jgi:hypothetical protein
MYGRIRAKGSSGRVMRLILLAAAGVLGMCSSASATQLSYTFDSNNQGWLQSQNNGNTTSSAGFQASGGNPGGRLTAVDTGAETGCPTTTPCNLLYFFSPIVPTLGANYGGSASFDLRSSVNPAFAAELLLLPPGTSYLDGLISESAGTAYHRLSIPLNETGNWAVCPYAGGNCTAPSQTEFMSLLGASDQFAVMADVGPNGTGETYDLDNVTLTDGTPPAPAPGPTPTPKKKCKKKHSHKAAAAKKCKKKHGRAASARLRG